MADNVDLSREARISFHEELVDAVGFLQDNVAYLFPVGALIEKDVQRKIRYKGSCKGYSFDGNIFQGGI